MYAGKKEKIMIRFSENQRRYTGLANTAQAYTNAFNRLHANLIAGSNPIYSSGTSQAQPISQAQKLRTVLDTLQRNYKDFRFALIAAEEHTQLFLKLADASAQFGVDNDSRGNPVIGFGYD
jgi:hypothetical protein